MAKGNLTKLTTNEKGYLGEMKFKSIIEHAVGDDVKVLYNVNIPKVDNDTTQVDFMIFSPHKFICVEVKAWDCTIYVRSTRYWKIVYGNREIMVVNPIQQNASHVSAIHKQTTKHFENRVCFVEAPDIYDAPEEVVSPLEIIKEISTGPVLYTAEEVEAEYQKFKKISQDSLYLAMYKALNIRKKPHKEIKL